MAKTKAKAPPKKKQKQAAKPIEKKPIPKKSRQKKHRRYAVVYDINGPRVRLGILWFVFQLLALGAGVPGLCVVYGATAAVAALQTAVVWRRAGQRPNRVVAGAGAAGLVVTAASTTGMLGFAILCVVGAALFTAFSAAAATRRRNPVDDAALTLRCSLFVGFAAACVIVAARFEYGSVVGLVLLVAAYEVGDFVVGSGAGNVLEGPVAGAIAVLVISFALTAVGIEPFVFPQSFVLGGMVAVLAPLGQLTGSAILPDVTSPAAALRRLDSLLVLAPAWALVVGWLV